MYHWQIGENGRFELYLNDTFLFTAYAKAFHLDKRSIDTRTSNVQSVFATEDALVAVYEAENGLRITEELCVKQGVPTARCTLWDADGSPVTTNRLVPLVFQDDRPETATKLSLFTSLWTRMLCVPYDNTMWLRFEALPLHAGRVSYDMTALIDPDSREGLLVGALNFDAWKNALVCSACDAKTIEAVSGWVDGGSHDVLPHGALTGPSVSSSAFCVLYGSDWRDLLERYGDLLHNSQPILSWPEGSPFGYNSWAGLAFRLNEASFCHTGRFLRDKLRPASFENDGTNYMNLDACWHNIGIEGLERLREEQRAGGQRTGIYDAPFAFFGRDVKTEIPGFPGHSFEEMLLRDETGQLLPRVDGAIPMDVTHPLWRAHTQRKLDSFIQWGYDYVKLDFLSHGGMEGVHSDPGVSTGRQALVQGYRFIAGLLDPVKTGRNIFISLSIAPMLPFGFGHARRFSCDAFGANEDVEYVLNAQTYGWWQNRRLYAFNDPDHIVLLRSFGMKRDSTEGEARARYTTAAIAGGVMMLSDDYDRPEAMARAETFATNAAVNAVARARADFRPVEPADAYASHAFTATIGGKPYLALFSFASEHVTVRCDRAGIPEGRWRDLWTGRVLQSENGVLTWQAQDCDALLLEKF